VIGQALGKGSLPNAKANAWLTIRLSVLLAVVLGLLYGGCSFLLPSLYPKVGEDVLRLTFWGVFIMAVSQPAKILSSVLGNGVLASGGDTRFILLGNVAGTYAIGLPAAIGLGLFTGLGFFGVFGAKVLEECVKATCFLVRFLKYRWYEHALQAEKLAKEEAERTEDEENEPPASVTI
ncbi:MAG: hypothetical protein JO271_19025, partial [Verrucomicrobia bacterium]|nr:hypothetical protein [Verrucomicrobiota bacterium]